jgi:hypothetical protein
MKLNRNWMIRSHIHEKKIGRHLAASLTDKLEPIELDPFQITLIDVYPTHEQKKFKKRFASFLNSHKRYGFDSQPERKLDELIDSFDSYKGIAWGSIFHNDFKNNNELDLIDRVQYSYIKGPSSSFLILFRVTPSDIYKKLFKRALEVEPYDQHTFKYYNLTQTWRNKRILATISGKPVYPNKYVTKVLNELKFQFQKLAKKGVKMGTYTCSKKYLYPSISTYEFSGVTDLTNWKNLEPYLRIDFRDFYKTKDSRYAVNYPYPDLVKEPSYDVIALYPKLDEEQERKDSWNTTYNLSRLLVDGIAANWMFTNECVRHRTQLSTLDKSISKYSNSKQDSVFLKRTLDLSKKLTYKWYSLNRFGTDFSHRVFNRYHDIPDYFNDSLKSIKGEELVLTKEVTRSTKYIFDETMKTYDNLLSYFKVLSQDNQTRSSMRLQAILLVIAIIGTIVALATSDYIMPFLKPVLEKWLDIEFPK